MKTMKIFEPAMCCPTGLCGVGVNPELLRMATVIDNLKKNGVSAERFNLNSAPQKFIENKAVNQALQQKGTDVLPITMIDDKIMLSGRYPKNEELIKWLEVAPEKLQPPKTEKKPRHGGGGCCC